MINSIVFFTSWFSITYLELSLARTRKIPTLFWAFTLQEAYCCLNPHTGNGEGYFTPSTDFVKVRKLANKIERIFLKTLLQMLWSFKNRWVHVNIHFRFIRTWPEVRTKSRKKIFTWTQQFLKLQSICNNVFKNLCSILSASLRTITNSVLGGKILHRRQSEG